MKLSWAARGAASAERGRRLMALRGVTPNGYPLWQGWEIQPVLDLYPEYGSIFPLLDRRSHPAIYSKAGRLGITTLRQEWTDNELLRLRIYRTGTREEILAAFPGRTWSAIARAANKRRHFRPKRRPEASSIAIIDQILARASSLNMTLQALDEAGRRRGYFTRYMWRRKLEHPVHQHVVEALGGCVRARFNR